LLFFFFFLLLVFVSEETEEATALFFLSLVSLDSLLNVRGHICNALSRNCIIFALALSLFHGSLLSLPLDLNLTFALSKNLHDVSLAEDLVLQSVDLNITFLLVGAQSEVPHFFLLFKLDLLVEEFQTGLNLQDAILFLNLPHQIDKDALLCHRHLCHEVVQAHSWEYVHLVLRPLEHLVEGIL
jgi:hypothetical protein